MESKLLAAITCDRKAWEEIQRDKPEQIFSEPGRKVYAAITAYYEQDHKASCVDKEILKDRLCREFPLEKHQTLFTTIVDNFEDVSVPNILQELKALEVENIRDDIRACVEGGNNDKLLKLLKNFEECLTQAENGEDLVALDNISVEEVCAKTSNEALIQLYPKAINETLEGGLLRGDHVLVFARPDVGKTTLAVEMTYGFLVQGLKVLYICNEDSWATITRRLMSRITRVKKKDIDSEQDKVQYRLDKKGFYQNFKIKQLTPGTLSEISCLIERHNPDVLLVDQCRNLVTGNKNRVEELEHIERGIRVLGQQHDMVTVSFTQAGDSADNKLILTMGDVDWSNTGMQGACDVMIGMGINAEYERIGRRMLAFPKNKKSGDKQPRQVNFDGDYSRIY